MTKYGEIVSAPTTQTEKADAIQVKNNAGGYVFEIDVWKRLDRFLIIGTIGGTYYTGERELTKENAFVVQECLTLDFKKTIDRIAEVSDKGLAQKNDQAIFALALAASHANQECRRYALANLSKVCRIGTHLFMFVDDVDKMRSWGRSLRSAVGKWYTEMSPPKLANMLIKYQQRGGWSNADLLRSCHVKAPSPEHEAAFRWALKQPMSEKIVKVRKVDGTEVSRVFEAIPSEFLHPMFADYESLMSGDVKNTIALIEKHKYTHEMIPTAHKNEVAVWAALLENMPMHAMVRNLGKMSSIGLVTELSAAAAIVCNKLASTKAIEGSRMHPLSLLSAMMVYHSGHGIKGELKWTPCQNVLAALEGAFYASFKNVKPTGKPIVLGLDVSGSMSHDSQVPGLTCMMVAATMAMVTARVEPVHLILAFASKLTHLNINHSSSISEVMTIIEKLDFGLTDCALPIVWALESNVGNVGAFVTYTDNETYFGPVHVYEAMRMYKKQKNPHAKLAAVACTATKYSVADPRDPDQMDFVGFSSDTPQALAHFISE